MIYREKFIPLFPKLFCRCNIRILSIPYAVEPVLRSWNKRKQQAFQLYNEFFFYLCETLKFFSWELPFFSPLFFPNPLFFNKLHTVIH